MALKLDTDQYDYNPPTGAILIPIDNSPNPNDTVAPILPEAAPFIVGESGYETGLYRTEADMEKLRSQLRAEKAAYEQQVANDEQYAQDLADAINGVQTDEMPTDAMVFTGETIDGESREKGMNATGISAYYGSIDPAHPTAHKGVDITAAKGSPLYSPPGTWVVVSTFNTANRSTFKETDKNKKFAPDVNTGWGNQVVLQNPQTNEILMLSHLDKGSVTVQSGQVLNASVKIGAIGSTGNSSGPHLDITYKVNGKITNPMNWSGISFYTGGKKGGGNPRIFGDYDDYEVVYPYSESHPAIDITSVSGEVPVYLPGGKWIIDEYGNKIDKEGYLGNYVDNDGRGNYVVAKNLDNGHLIEYRHLAPGTVPDFPTEVPIDGGIQIGMIGGTGNTSGRHLHTEFMDENGEKYNPFTTDMRNYFGLTDVPFEEEEELIPIIQEELIPYNNNFAINGHSFDIISDTEISEDIIKNIKSTLGKFYQKFPQFVEKVSKIVIRNEQPPSVLGDEEKFPLNGVSPYDDSIVLYSRTLENSPWRFDNDLHALPATIIHEIMHKSTSQLKPKWEERGFKNSNIPAGFEKVSGDDYYGIYENDKGRIVGKDGHSMIGGENITIYGSSDLDEDIADSMVVYLLRPEELKQKAPTKFEILENFS